MIKIKLLPFTQKWIESFKQELAHREWKNRNDYAAAKTAFIKQVEDKYYE